MKGRTYFTDRDLGHQFPDILRAAGLHVEHHTAHFAPAARDDEWLPEVGRRGWVVLTHDQQIRWKVNERAAVMESGVAMFIVIGQAPLPQLAPMVVNTWPLIERFLDHNAAPFIAKLSRPSPAQLKKNAGARGRVQMWLTHSQWMKQL